MKQLSFRRIKDSHGIVEKTLVDVHGLPLFNHSAVPLRHNVNSILKIPHNCFLELGGKHFERAIKKAKTRDLKGFRDDS